MIQLYVMCKRDILDSKTQFQSKNVENMSYKNKWKEKFKCIYKTKWILRQKVFAEIK